MKTEELMSEMMLARSVLDEKNELLDEKDRVIRGLRTRVDELERNRCDTSTEKPAPSSLETQLLVAEVVCIVGDYTNDDPPNDLAARLMRHFQDNYRVEVIEACGDRIDPRVHKIVEVDRTVGSDPAVHLLRPGYRIAGKTIRPALVKIVKGDGDLPVVNRPRATT